MSGSYDRPTGPPMPPPPAPRLRPRNDAFTAPPSSSAGQPFGTPLPASGPPALADHDFPPQGGSFQEPRGAPPPHSYPPAPPAIEDELRADERPSGRGAAHGQNVPIVPGGSVTGKSLTLVVSIMCFLACLTAGAVYMVNQSASAWLRDIASEVTVQIEPRERVDTDRTIKEVTVFLQQQPGVRGVKPMSTEESAALIEPWLGTSDALKALPLPRLIAIDLDRSAPPDFGQLKKRLADQFKGASLDDHRHWQHQIRTATRSLALGGLAILMLVGAATTAIIISATRSAMSSNREIVEVLHFVGATDRFIAREFEKHFLRLGVRAGIMGAVLASLIFLGLPGAMELLGGGSVTLADMSRLMGLSGLDAAGYLVLAVVVVVIAGLCMLTSRFGVYRILNAQQ